MEPITLISFFTVMGLVGLLTWIITRKSDLSTSDGYFLGGRSLTFPVIAGTLLLTNLSTEQLVGLNGAAYTDGLSVMAWEVVAVIALVLMAIFFLPKFLRSGITTLPQYLEIRYDSLTSTITNFIFLIAYAVILLPIILYTGAVGLGMMMKISVITGIDNPIINLWILVWGVGITGAIYALFGGLKTVAVSDTLNGIGLLVGGFMILFFGLNAISGGEGVLKGFSILNTTDPQMFNSIGAKNESVPFGTLFTGVMIINIFYWCTNQQIIQRTFGASSLEEGIPEVQIRVDKDKAAQYGLTSYGVANNVRNTLLGKTATRFKFEGEEINVVIKGDAQYSESLSNLGLIPLSIPSGGTVQLSQVADIVQDLGPVTIQRQDQARVVTVSSETFGRDVQSVTDDINTRLADYQLPQGYIISYGGESELIEDAFNDLLLVLILAIVLVYMILAAQFESLVQPLAIMFTVPLALSGGFLGLFITGVDLSVPAIIGFIVLVGIVVNNAIVLVDYINKRRSFGEDRREAILNAGPIRLRPILMTAMTTILGLLPLSLGIGEGSELQMPMAVVVIGGLLLSTILTLVYVPVVYTIIDDIACFLRRFLRIKEEGEPDVRCG